jgi:RNA polymerase sigma-54 factor
MPLGLQLRAKQQLGLSPQLQAAIRLMQLSTQELRAEMESFAQSNPLLEIDYEHSSDNELGKTYFKSPIITTQLNEFSDDALQSVEHDESLHEVLIAQLDHYTLSTKDEMIGLAIIDSITMEGYLSLNCAEIISILNLQKIAVKKEEVEKILAMIQSFEPAGVGARNLSECLLLQLERKEAQNDIVACAKRIVAHYLGLLLGRDSKKILKKSGLTQERCELALKLIQSLNPRPGAQYSSVEQNYQVPDIVVRKVKDNWVIELNDQLLPRLKINNHYSTLLGHSKNQIDQEYRRHKLKEANWLITSIENRHETLYGVSKKIVEHQRQFFEYGPLALRPLTLQTIAAEVDRHESTVSRIVTQKTMLTPHGLFELKYFFSSQVSTDQGQSVSSRAIRALIEKIIKEEDAQNPRSDSALCRILQSQGIRVARRTVAKYRETMGILSSTSRKSPLTNF